MRGRGLLIRGQVQGVGFRPTVWRVAREMSLTGEVRNTAEGVEIRVWGEAEHAFEARLRAALPGAARIERIARFPLEQAAPERFRIAASGGGNPGAAVVTPDRCICADCVAEIGDPFARRYRYPFTNCTACGPRLSIVESAPYDRERTSMADFALCAECRAEFEDPDDRRFHAQPIACHACGPRAWLEKLGGGAVNLEAFSMMDDVDAAGGALMNGFIVAIKGIGGVHLACDATRADVLAELRRRKRRPHKPLALMARDLDVIRDHAEVSAAEEALLTSAEAPIVLLEARAGALPEALAPGLDRLGFMLPHSALHHLVLRRMKRPVVMTSGNLSAQPPCTDNEAVRERLAAVADFALLHDRRIANRVDDSVVQVVRGVPRSLRRARGYAPCPLPLPAGFDPARRLTALGGELKNTVCLVGDGRALLSQHLGDLEELATFEEAGRALSLLGRFHAHDPEALVVDAHPDYLSTRRAHEIAGGRPVLEVQHHHAHIAACLGEHGRALHAAPVLGIAMDGLGLGDDGTLWGGEFLIGDYGGYRRVGHLKPVRLPGGAAAVREPWRNAHAHLMAEMGWAELAMNFRELPLFERLEAMPRATLDAMMATGTNAPLCSSCGRLFDAAAALCGLAWERQSHEGQAAMAFEAALDPAALAEPKELAYPFTLPLMHGKGLPYIEPLGVWRAMLGDLVLGTPIGTVSARFHRGLAAAIARLGTRLIDGTAIDTVALSGGCFQNATLLELVTDHLAATGLTVLTPASVPANDGGLAFGQALVGLARLQKE